VPQSFSNLLRRLLSLLMQILIVLLLVAAVADPVPLQSQARTVIVLDTSCTMQTRDASGRTRLESAAQLCHQVIDRCGNGEIGIVTVGTGSSLVQEPTYDHDQAIRAVDTAKPCESGSDLFEALTFASHVAGSSRHPRVIVVSDFDSVTPGHLRSSWKGAQGLSLLRIGEPVPNASITNVWTDRKDDGFHASASITQTGMDGRAIAVQLVMGGKIVESNSISLAGPSARIEMTTPLRVGDAFEILAQTGDGLAVDDCAFGVVTAYSPRICLVTSGDKPLEAAIQAGDPAAVDMVAPDRFTTGADYDVVIIDGSSPGNHPLPARAAYLFLGPCDPFGWALFDPPVKSNPVSDWAADHPFTADVDPSSLKLVELFPTRWQQGIVVNPLVNAGSMPCIVEATSPELWQTGKRIYWLFDFAKSNLSNQTMFPVLLWNSIDYLTGQKARSAPSWAGRPVRLGSANSAMPSCEDPDGHPLRVVAADGFWTFTPDRPGLYQVNEAGSQRIIAVNRLLTTGAEADMSDHGDELASVGQARMASFLTAITWRRLAIAATTLAAVEGALFLLGFIRLGGA